MDLSTGHRSFRSSEETNVYTSNAYTAYMTTKLVITAPADAQLAKSAKPSGHTLMKTKFDMQAHGRCMISKVLHIRCRICFKMVDKTMPYRYVLRGVKLAINTIWIRQEFAM